MIDLTNNFNEISSILGDSSEEEINSFCQARSAETIWPFRKKGAQGVFEQGSSNENLLADDSKTLNKNNQKDQKGNRMQIFSIAYYFSTICVSICEVYLSEIKINLILGLCTSCAFFYNQYCNQVHQLTRSHSQKQRPDDTDSFTPRVRSDKRSITLLLGKLLYNKDI